MASISLIHTLKAILFNSLLMKRSCILHLYSTVSEKKEDNFIINRYLNLDLNQKEKSGVLNVILEFKILLRSKNYLLIYDILKIPFT